VGDLKKPGKSDESAKKIMGSIQKKQSGGTTTKRKRKR